jgi:hypothetical protein
VASAAWERRNASARAKGYASYYDYRSHGFGRTPPSAPRASGAELAALRGHRSAKDLERLIDSGRVEMLNVQRMVDARGRFGIEVLATTSTMQTITFWISEKQAPGIQDAVQSQGADAPAIEGSPRSLSSFDTIDVDEFDDDLDAWGEFDELADEH